MPFGSAGRRIGAITKETANAENADLASLFACLSTAWVTAWRFVVGLAQAALLIAAIVIGSATIVKFVDALMDAIHP